MDKFIWFALLIFLPAGLIAQEDNSSKDNFDKQHVIDEYEVFNKFLGGDSVRQCHGSPCSGRIKDHHENGELKHKGFYDDGKLTTSYKNYFDNGQLERSFQKKNSNKAEVEIYYKNGEVRSEITYLHSEPLEWTEYFPNGEKESYERHHKSLEFLEERIYFFSTGQKQSHLKLKNEDKKNYDKTIFYEKGEIKAEGEVLYNPYIHAYRREGEWKFYSEDGELEVKQQYVKGKVVEEEKL
ncbi:MAG: toxin-antitoxin system YwqK family antitoxin [Bacteroidota bacterium]